MATVCERERAEKEIDVFLAMGLHLSPVKPNAPNFVFSPLTLRALLSICAAGSNTPTAQQLLSALKSDSVDDLNAFSKELFSKLSTNGNMTLANGIWIHKGCSVKQSFKQAVEDVYKADLHQSDFTTKALEIESRVNSWVKYKTNGLIHDIMPRGSVSEIDRLILINALYFKCIWSYYYFKPAEYTKDYDFHLLDGKSVKVPFMRSDFLFHSIGIFDDFKALRIDYRTGKSVEFCMYILLPDSVDGLAALAERVYSERNFLNRHLCSRYIIRRAVNEGNLRVPKFKFSFEFEANETLKKLGVTMPFEVGALSEMVDPSVEGQLLFVREIFQKTLIEVNEEGTTVSAFFRSICGGGCPKLPPKKVDFVADHPFMFLIREETSRTVLFLGHVLNPLQN